MSIMAYTRLSLPEREEISRCLAEDPGVSWSELGRLLGRHRCTIQREVARNGGRCAYRATDAQRRAEQLRPCSRSKLLSDPMLRGRVRDCLETGYSPAATSVLVGRAVSSETIYQGLYRGLLGLSPQRVLRSRRHRRRRRNARHQQARTHVLGQFKSIHERPEGVENRSEFGHWEGDLIIGARNASALITLVERVSRRQVILDLPTGYQADRVHRRLDAFVAATPEKELRSLTWDRGSEMAHWPLLTMAWSLDIYFADPHSPWQRGTNENANRQLRYWLPKGTDLRTHSRNDLDRITQILNTQPRRSLDWKSADTVYAAHTAH